MRPLRTVAALAALVAGAVAVPAASGSAATDSCTYPPNRPVLSVDVSSDNVGAGQALEVLGQLTQNNCGIERATVVLQRQLLYKGAPHGSWRTFATKSTDARGFYFASRSPVRNESIRAFFAGDKTHGSAVSGSVPVAVHTRITMQHSVGANCHVTFTGDTTPTKRGKYVKIQMRGDRGSFNGWTTIVHTHTGDDGSYSVTKKLKCSKDYNISAETSGDSVNDSGRSGTAYGINPKH